MAKGRPVEFPDPKDRSVNWSSVLVEPKDILALYNQANPNEQYENYAEAVRSWFESEAKNRGWSEVDFIGGPGDLRNAVLKANVRLD